MNNSIKNSLWLISLGTLRGVTVLLHASFVLLIVWLLFVEAWDPLESSHATLLLLAYLPSIILHEASHLTFALLAKLKISQITLIPSGAIIIITSKEGTIKRVAFAAIAPLINLILALLIILIDGIPNLTNLAAPNSFTEALIAANLGIGFINLLPIYPLDGWRIGRSLVETGDNKLGLQKLSRISQVIAIILLATAIATSTPLLAILAILCSLSSVRDGFRLKTTMMANSMRVREVMINRGQLTLLPHSITISSAMDTVVKSFQRYFPVVHNEEALGLVVRDNFLNALAAGQSNDYISRIMLRDCPRIHTEDNLRPIIEKAFEDGQEVFIVLDGQESFAGLLVKNQVIELLLLGSIFDQSKGQELPDEFWL